MKRQPANGERFLIDGNRLVVTPRFDPRYQRDAESELLQTLQGMLDETGGETFVLDLHARDSLPSLLVGIIAESHRRVVSAGGTLVLRIRPGHLKELQWAGLPKLFAENGEKTDEHGVVYLEYVSRPPDA